MKKVVNQIHSNEDQQMISICPVPNQLHQISSRMTVLYEYLTNLFVVDRSQHLSLEQYRLELQIIFQAIIYKDEKVGGPICCQSSDKTISYQCLDCEIGTYTTICEQCFLQGQHVGHKFTVQNCVWPCNCGNQLVLNKQFFCAKHKYFKQPTKMNNKQAKIFSKQLQYLLLLSFHHFNKLRASKSKKQTCLSVVLQLYQKYLEINYNYQKLAAQVLVNKFDDHYGYGEDDSILKLLIVNAGWFKKVMNQISGFLYTLQPVQQAKVKIIVHYWNTIKQGLQNFKTIGNIQTIDLQFMIEPEIILNLLRNGRIAPLQIGQNIQTAQQQIEKYQILFKIYQLICDYASFGQFISITLTHMSITSFYNYHNCAKQLYCNRDLQDKYLGLLHAIVQKIKMLQNRRELLIKMIRDSYKYLKQCQKNLRRCPKVTFSTCLFALYDFDLQKLTSIGVNQLFTLLQVNQQAICQFLNRLICQQDTLIVNFKSSVQSVFNNPQLPISTEYLFYKIVYAIHLIINKQSIDLSPFIQADFNRLKKSDQNIQSQHFSQQGANKLCQTRQQRQRVCLTLLNIIFAFQTALPQTIVECCLYKGNRMKIFQFYRSLYMANKEMNKADFKTYAENWILSYEYLRQFITQEALKINKQQKYCGQNNISFISQYCNFNQVSKDEKQQRLIMNLTSDRHELDKILGSSLKIIEELLIFITEKEIQSTKEECIYLIDIVMVMFAWTKSDKYLELIDTIFKKIGISKIPYQYKEYRLIIEKTLKQKDEQTIRKRSKSKKLQKLQEMRLKQQKILKQHQQQISIVQKNISKQQNSCILCHQQKNEKLSYLCHASFTKNLTKNVFKVQNDHYVLISTCGHVIHEKCLSSSVSPNHSYSQQLRCFLCKKLSNLRIPIYQFYTQQTQKELKYNQRQERKFNRYYKFVQQFITILSLQKNQYEALQSKNVDLKVQKFGQIISKSIILSLYFYFLSFPKVYITYMLPFLGSLCSLVKFGLENKLSNKICKLKYQIADIEFQEVQKMFMQMINLGSHQMSQQKIENMPKQQQYNPKTQLIKLKMYLINHKDILFNYTRSINRLNLYTLPKDLVQLNRQFGKCYRCEQTNSKLKICFYCGIKVCFDCKTYLQTHINYKHKAAGIIIDNQFGHYYYCYNKMRVKCQSLYCDYVGQSFQCEHLKPKQGYYLLDDKEEETLITNALLQNMSQIIAYDTNIDDRCRIQ